MAASAVAERSGAMERVRRGTTKSLTLGLSWGKFCHGGLTGWHAEFISSCKLYKVHGF